MGQLRPAPSKSKPSLSFLFLLSHIMIKSSLASHVMMSPLGLARPHLGQLVFLLLTLSRLKLKLPMALASFPAPSLPTARLASCFPTAPSQLSSLHLGGPPPATPLPCYRVGKHHLGLFLKAPQLPNSIRGQWFGKWAPKSK